MIIEVLELFGADFTLHLSHRGVLNCLARAAGVADEHFRGVCAAIDQLDKLSREEVL